jgi:hypothetical protein
MTILKASEVLGLAMTAGFTRSQANVMTVIAYYESGWDPKNVGDQSLSAFGSRGLWQIFSGAHDPNEVLGHGGTSTADWTDALILELEDPAANAKAAHIVWKSQGYRAWSTYNNLRLSSSWATLLAKVAKLPAPGGVVTPPNPASPAKDSLDLKGNINTTGIAGWRKAAHTTSWPPDMCLNFVRSMYGLAGKYARAIDQWNAVPDALRHSYYTAPVGVPVCWSGGSTGAGHIALSDGNGYVFSTDISGAGTVSRVHISEIQAKWGETYLGWIETCEDVRVYTMGDGPVVPPIPAPAPPSTFSATPAEQWAADTVWWKWFLSTPNGLAYTQSLQQ